MRIASSNVKNAIIAPFNFDMSVGSIKVSTQELREYLKSREDLGGQRGQAFTEVFRTHHFTNFYLPTTMWNVIVIQPHLNTSMSVNN